MIKNCFKIILFFPSKCNPLAIRISTATEIKSEQIKTEWHQHRSVASTLVLISRISMHVYNTGSLCSFRSICNRSKCTLEILLLLILDDEIRALVSFAPKIMSKSHIRICWILTPWWPDYQAEEGISLSLHI